MVVLYWLWLVIASSHGDLYLMVLKWCSEFLYISSGTWEILQEGVCDECFVFWRVVAVSKSTQ